MKWSTLQTMSATIIVQTYIYLYRRHQLSLGKGVALDLAPELNQFRRKEQVHTMYVCLLQ